MTNMGFCAKARSAQLVNFPKTWHSSCRKFPLEIEKPSISAIFQNWHGPCDHCGIRRNGPADNTRIGKIPMLGFSQMPARFTAAVSAFALSLALIGATVSMPSQAQAQTSGAYVGVVA
jgi:hypothetical protein